MKYRICMLAILVIMSMATASADNWKNRNFRKQSSTTVWSRKGSSNHWESNKSWSHKDSYVSWWNTIGWNYSGTQLNGITHGGGSDPYNRNYDRNYNKNENRGWDFSQANGRYDITRQSTGVKANVNGSYSFNIASPAAGTRAHLVTSKTFAEGTGRHFVSMGSGGSTEKMYRYAPQKNHYGENMGSTANMVAVKQSSSSSVSSSSPSSDDIQMDENGKNGMSHIGRKGTGGGPGGVPGAGEAPLGDGLLVLLLMTRLFAAWKMRG